MQRIDGIWVPKNLDFSGTAEFGDMKIIWGPHSSNSRSVIEREALDVAERYDPTCDYVVALGSPTLIAILGWAIGSLDKPLRMLEWSKKTQRYYPTIS